MRCQCQRLSIVILFLFVALSASWGTAFSQEQISMKYVGSTPWLETRNIYVSGDYAYCTQMYGLVIIDIGDVENPHTISRLYMDNSVPDYLAVSGEKAYIISNDGDLWIIDISDKFNPVLLSRNFISYHIKSVKVTGDYAYVVKDKSLAVIDISNSAAPAIVGEYGSILINDLDIVDDRIYGTTAAGLAVYDINGFNIIGSYDNPNTSPYRWVKVDGDYAYVTDSAGLSILNISDPNGIYNISACPLDYSPIGMQIGGDYVLTLSYGQLDVINVTDISTPGIVSTFYNNSVNDNVYNRNLYCDNMRAYVSCTSMIDGFIILDFTDPADLTPVGIFNSLICGWPHGFDIVGDLAYIAGEDSTFVVVDISNPADPIVLGKCTSPSFAWNVKVSGNYAFVADNSGGLMVIDVSDPSEPYAVSTYDTPSYARDVNVVDNLAYIADRESGIIIFDISDPLNPVMLGEADTPGPCIKFAVQGDYAYVADGNFQVINIANPSNPYHVFEYITPKSSEAIAVEGDYAYVTVDKIGLYIFDISNPENPVFVDSAYVGKSLSGAYYSSGYVYLCGYWPGSLHIIDVSDPTCPIIVYENRLEMIGLDIMARDNVVYVAGLITFFIFQHTGSYVCGDIDGRAGINLLDISFMIYYLYKGGASPQPPEAGDVDGSGVVNILDATYMINYLYKGGSALSCQ